VRFHSPVWRAASRFLIRLILVGQNKEIDDNAACIPAL
jgi:hypothetical protein